MTPEYVAAIGRFAYVWGWPLVNNLNRATAVEKLPEPGRLGGVLPMSPPGQISMLTDYINENQRFVTCPNQDTVYGAGYQRLDTKPVVIQVVPNGNSVRRNGWRPDRKRTAIFKEFVGLASVW
jgi:hypothetical protein